MGFEVSNTQKWAHMSFQHNGRTRTPPKARSVQKTRGTSRSKKLSPRAPELRNLIERRSPDPVQNRGRLQILFV